MSFWCGGEDPVTSRKLMDTRERGVKLMTDFTFAVSNLVMDKLNQSMIDKKWVPN